MYSTYLGTLLSTICASGRAPSMQGIVGSRETRDQIRCSDSDSADKRKRLSVCKKVFCLGVSLFPPGAAYYGVLGGSWLLFITAVPGCDRPYICFFLPYANVSSVGEVERRGEGGRACWLVVLNAAFPGLPSRLLHPYVVCFLSLGGGGLGTCDGGYR
ncbi:hypothetical protein F4861DRAFT_202931 [Xylaria intraflava]|nr:hypothetical protein F4861DRAFT_202931 [Xylaria intraflava]